MQAALPGSTLVIAIDPGKVTNRVWLSTGEAGEVVPPMSLPVLRPGLEQLHRRWLAEGLAGGSDPADFLWSGGDLATAAA
jgi:hypothetical protein